MGVLPVVVYYSVKRKFIIINDAYYRSRQKLLIFEWMTELS